MTMTKKNKLYVLIGAPGSGKSTFAKKYLTDAVYVSRDIVRFSILQEGEEYFAREDEVYREFIWKIYDNLQNGKDVIADATHLNPRSRAKLFDALPLDLQKTEVIGIFFKTSIETCLKRNDTRKGNKTYVPAGQVRRMFFCCDPPTFIEYNGIFSELWGVDTEKNEYEIRKYNKEGEIT